MNKLSKQILKERIVGIESQKSYIDNIESGFFDKYMSGNGLEIGGRGANGNTTPILPTAEMIDIGYPGYDGLHLPFPDNSQSWVYSSHCLEHIEDYKAVIQDWYRVTKVGGHIVISVPHRDLYERKLNIPSRWNGDHKRVYTPGSFLAEIEKSLIPNTYRVRLLKDCDHEYNYSINKDQHPSGQYEILLVIQKIQKPTWDVE